MCSSMFPLHYPMMRYVVPLCGAEAELCDGAGSYSHRRCQPCAILIGKASSNKWKLFREAVAMSCKGPTQEAPQ